MKAVTSIRNLEDVESFRNSADFGDAGSAQQKGNHLQLPKILNASEVLALKAEKPVMLFDDLPIPACGASLTVSPPKAGKTISGVGMAYSIATGRAFLGYFKPNVVGPVLIIEQDDPSGAASIKQILKAAGMTSEDSIHVVEKLPFSFGPAFYAWLRESIARLQIVFVLIDSYTSMRGSRTAGGDIVKIEQQEMRQTDDLAKSLNCAILLVHHNSKGSSALDWSDKAAGTYAMSAATEAQMYLSRFRDLDIKAPERLLRIRSRHGADCEHLLRFREETLDFEHVLEGGAAPLYPMLLQIWRTFGSESFTPKVLRQQTGMSAATVFRHLEQLHHAGGLDKQGRGDYRISQMAVRALRVSHTGDM